MGVQVTPVLMDREQIFAITELGREKGPRGFAECLAIGAGFGREHQVHDVSRCPRAEVLLPGVGTLANIGLGRDLASIFVACRAACRETSQAIGQAVSSMTRSDDGCFDLRSRGGRDPPGDEGFEFLVQFVAGLPLRLAVVILP